LHPGASKQMWNEMNEKSLLEKARDGDSAAFDDLVRLRHRDVHGLALRMLKNEQDADEAAQKVFIKAFRNLSGFRGDSNFGTWLYTITMNECRSHLKSRKNVAELNGQEMMEYPGGKSPFSRILDNETAAAAADAVDQLPDKQRLIVTLRINHELSFREIGVIAECSEQTAKVNFHYGVENLRKKLRQNGTL
jgi:RNA polymerase sigma-70 factor, ECF subfamily